MVVIMVDSFGRCVSILWTLFEINHLILAYEFLVVGLFRIFADDAGYRPTDVQQFLQILIILELVRERQAVGREGTVLCHHEIQVFILLLHLLILMKLLINIINLYS
jgi:hypothetical protein